ncbi:hypothetical protein NQ317_015245 [Molorchus minor]|uniref:Uncharacterized protein n=1 Tax=Molorchus minor TaxID=1323400 RepID=A0ABQ9JP43_9CUCU|nr:hypothetical protein NQ317_015245 [Molorchus minor]
MTAVIHEGDICDTSRRKSLMCAIGLVENSNVYLLSSMLICPMMGPVMAGTFGSVIEHRRLLKIGVQNELIGLGMATVVGFCYGSLICLITDKYGNQTWPTYEMLSSQFFALFLHIQGESRGTYEILTQSDEIPGPY